MKAMILAAGLGTRLRPITDDRPKALVEVAGRTLLEITLKRLSSFGVSEVIVNVHHHAEMIIEYLRVNKSFGMKIALSREDELLDTGGGLTKAAPFFVQDAGQYGPFIVHNVDVISSIDLSLMARHHVDHGALATLAVQNRETSRYLLFDEEGQLCGRRAANGADELARPAHTVQALAFSGIHVVSPRFFDGVKKRGAFSIIDAYLHLAALGEKIVSYNADGCYWRDLGRPASLQQAELDLAAGEFS
jgi:NDP-sugar pyrophosphorylase family protein